MNKNQAFMLIVALAVLGITGSVVLLILAPASADKFITLLVTLTITLGGFAGLTAQQAKQDEKIETIKANTNGNLTRAQNQAAVYRAALQERAPDVLAEIDAAAVVVTRADPE